MQGSGSVCFLAGKSCQTTEAYIEVNEEGIEAALGRQKFKTKVVKKCLNPTWGEEFSFKEDDLHEELVISVLSFLTPLGTPSNPKARNQRTRIVAVIMESKHKEMGGCLLLP
ncbi:hypothetical protein K2173_020427 [Erythroxylum novogranatense]|uniref:C2 domain-containing protein n=1 Tax=Erythroxylum novogranatense TaxID=1862640 RepID=A0AAV8TGA1_9ROSI|nr:hypothetical protein K2173_020427 [Erythroxylum novogranatense]